jgi:hypothetical protein
MYFFGAGARSVAAQFTAQFDDAVVYTADHPSCAIPGSFKGVPDAERAAENDRVYTSLKRLLHNNSNSTSSSSSSGSSSSSTVPAVTAFSDRLRKSGLNLMDYDPYAG